MLFHTNATMYGYSRDETTGISTYGSTGEVFQCNIQPLTANDGLAMGLEGGTLYNKYRVYTRKSLKPGDKLSILGDIYIVDSVAMRRGLNDSFNKVICSKSDGI